MKKTDLKRRSFLGAGFLTVGTLLASPLNLKGTSNSFLVKNQKIFLTESGNFGEDSQFVIGCISSDNDSANHEAAIQKYREENKYRNTLSYKSNDKFKVPFAKDIIKYFVETKELSFTACLVDFGKNPKMSPVEKQKFRFECYQNLLAEKPFIKGDQAIAKSFTPFGPNGSFTQEFTEKIGIDYKAINAYDSNLLQLSSLLTGCLLSEVVKVCEHPIKNELVKYLATSLNVSSLIDIENIEKFKIIHI